MAVRVRVRISGPRGDVETSALVNSGYEASTPQILVPRRLAERLGLYPPPENATSVEMGTAAGPARMTMVRRGARVTLLAGDREVGPVTVDVVISGAEEEVLLSDQLSEKLGIVLLAIASGRWRLADDPPGKIRTTVEPEFW